MVIDVENTMRKGLFKFIFLVKIKGPEKVLILSTPLPTNTWLENEAYIMIF